MYSYLSSGNKVLKEVLNKNAWNLTHNVFTKYYSKETVAFGNIVKEVNKVEHPEYVPRKYCKYSSCERKIGPSSQI